MHKEKDIQPNKKVRISIEPIQQFGANKDEEENNFLTYSLTQKTREKSYNKIKKHVLELLLDEKYEEAERYLREYLKDREKQFFNSEEGIIVFEQALNFFMNYGSLKCVLNFIDKTTIQKLLKQDDYDVIRTFVEREDHLMKTSIRFNEKKHMSNKLLLLYNKNPKIFKELIPDLDSSRVSADLLWYGLKIWVEKNKPVLTPKL